MKYEKGVLGPWQDSKLWRNDTKVPCVWVDAMTRGGIAEAQYRTEGGVKIERCCENS